MKTSGKVILFSVGAFGLTMGLVMATVIAVVVIAQPRSCADYGQTLLLLWGGIGVLCLGSTAVVSFGTRRLAASRWGSWTATAVYGLALLFAYLFIALVLMVAFNC